jgi:chorismate mutase
MQRNKIDQIRERIDQLDAKIIELLKQRLTAVEKIGALKREQNIEIEDNQRELFLQEQLESLARQNNLSLTFLKRIWDEILLESYRIQRGNEQDE